MNKTLKLKQLTITYCKIKNLIGIVGFVKKMDLTKTFIYCGSIIEKLRYYNEVSLRELPWV